MLEHADALTGDDDPSTTRLDTLGVQLAIDQARTGIAFDADLAAASAICTEHALGALADIGLGRQHDAPAGIARQRSGADGAAVLKRAGKDANRALLGQQLAEVEHTVGRRLHLEGHIINIETSQTHALASG